MPKALEIDIWQVLEDESNYYKLYFVDKIMKALKPSQKENKRYLLISSGKLNGKKLQEVVEKSILDFVGVLGMSKTGLGWIKAEKDLAPRGAPSNTLKDTSEGKGKVVACINREAVNSFRASIVVSEIKMQVEKVSGTLKGLLG